MKHFLPSDCLTLDRNAEETLQRQLYRQLRGLVEQRTLATGSKLPSSRSLASELGIARNTVVSVYEQLAAEGYVVVRHGARAEVADFPPRMPKRPSVRARRAAISRRGLAMLAWPRSNTIADRAQPPDELDTKGFPFGAWSRTVARHALLYRGAAGLSGTEGEQALREAIAGYVGVARGVRCHPEQIVVTTCAQAARDLLGRLLLDPGDTAWVEEPGYLGAQDAFLTAGARLLPLRVEDRHWQLDAPTDRPKVIYVSPTNQRPLGSTMQTEQRRHLLALANRLDAFIVEDDFDGDYNFGGRPVPTLHSSDTSDRVIYLGNFDRLLFPAMRIGFVVLPEGLVGAFQQSLNITGQSPPLLLQAALADFVDRGHMTLHLKRMRAVYAERRLTFRRLCETRLAPWLTLTQGDVGFSCVGLTRPGLDDVAIAGAAGRAGLCVSPLSTHYRFDNPRTGLVMSFGPISETDLPRAVDKLEHALRQASGDRN